MEKLLTSYIDLFVHNFFCNLSKISKENLLSKKSRGHRPFKQVKSK